MKVQNLKNMHSNKFLVYKAKIEGTSVYDSKVTIRYDMRVNSAPPSEEI